MAFFWAPGCSSWLPGVLGAKVDDPQDDSWRGSFAMWLYLMAKPFHMGVDVDWLAYPLHRPTVRRCQTRRHGFLLDTILSCRCSGWWHLSVDVKPPGRRYLMES
jgi:hypothetical protein